MFRLPLTAAIRLPLRAGPRLASANASTIAGGNSNTPSGEEMIRNKLVARFAPSQCQVEDVSGKLPV